MMKRSNDEKGSAHAVVVICLVLVIAAALGWIFWQNFIHKEEAAKDVSVVATEKEEETKSEAEQESEAAIDPTENGKYLVLKDWKVRFEIPNELKNTKVSYWKTTEGVDSGERYLFTTARVKALGGACDKNANYVTGKYSLDEIWRDTKAQAANPLNGGKAIGSYYYAGGGPGGGRSACSDSNVVSQDAMAIQKLIGSIEAY